MTAITIHQHPRTGAMHVWLDDCQNNLRSVSRRYSALIGAGQTRLLALHEAEATLLRALDAVRAELAKEGVIGGTMADQNTNEVVDPNEGAETTETRTDVDQQTPDVAHDVGEAESEK